MARRRRHLAEPGHALSERRLGLRRRRLLRRSTPSSAPSTTSTSSLREANKRGIKRPQRPRPEPHVRSAPVVLGSAHVEGRGEARLVRVGRPGARRWTAEQLGVELLGRRVDPRRADRAVLPAQLPADAARPQLVERRRRRRVRRHLAVLVRPRRRGVPTRRVSRHRQGPRAPRQPAGDTRRPTTPSRALRTETGLQRATVRRCTTCCGAGGQVAKSYDPERLLVGETFVGDLDAAAVVLRQATTSCISRSTSRSSSKFDPDRCRRRRRASSGASRSTRGRCWMGSNHDVEPASRRGGARATNARSRCALMMLLTLRGTPFLYYGDEIGMTDALRADARSASRSRRCAVLPVLPGRDPERTPMQWTSGRRCRVHEARSGAVAPVR